MSLDTLVCMTGAGFPTKSAIEAAGKYLRKIENGTIQDIDLDRMSQSIDVVTTFREAHSAPMNSVRMGLNSMLNSENIDWPATQRHKRVPRIVRKLVRMEGMSLARLEDIGGCRVVVGDAAEMDRLCRRIRKRWARDFTRDPDKRDYVASPKPMGYRARHFVVQRHGRLIEVQVRTLGQQRWADAVEHMDSRHQFNLKDELGPASLVENFTIAGELIYRQEWGLPLTADLVGRLNESNKRVIAEGYYSR